MVCSGCCINRPFRGHSICIHREIWQRLCVQYAQYAAFVAFAASQCPLCKVYNTLKIHKEHTFWNGFQLLNGWNGAPATLLISLCFMHSPHPLNPRLSWSNLDVCPGRRRIEKDVRFSYFWTRCVKLFLVRYTAFVIAFLLMILTSRFIFVPPKSPLSSLRKSSRFLNQTCPLNRPNVSCYYMLVQLYLR